MGFDYFPRGVHRPGVEPSPPSEPLSSEPEGLSFSEEAGPSPDGEELPASEATEDEVESPAPVETEGALVNRLPPVPFRVRQRYHRDNAVAARPKGVRWQFQWHAGLLVVPTILLAALLAHGLCVRAVFYLEDWPHIVANDWVDHGWWWEANQRAVTYFTYWLTYALFGMSAPAFHAGNLVIHGSVAVLVSGFARTFLTETAALPPERARRIGWWAGLLFAVHPLCSETLDYAQARDIELVTLFSVLAAWAALRWRRQRRPEYGWPSAMLLAVGAATFSKEVGFILAAGSAALVFLGTARPPEALAWRPVAMPLPGAPKAPKTKLVVSPKDAALLKGNWPVTLSLTLVAICLAAAAWPVWHTAYTALRHPRLGWHALTKTRVFWMYMQRVAWPAHLCSDHQITWTTTWDDPAAWAATAAVAAVVIGTAVVFLRGRGAARAASVLVALVLLDLLHRLANPDANLMVESRMYPAMWPLCMLIAWAIGTKAEGSRQTGVGDGSRSDNAEGGAESAGGSAATTQKVEGGAGERLLGVRWAVVIGLVGGCAVCSELRAQVWGSRETLVANVVAQYPFQGRAYQEIQDADVRAQYWTEALKDQAAVRQALNGAVNFNVQSPGRKFDPNELLLTHVESEGNYALGLARLGFKKEATGHLVWLQKSLQPGSLITRELNAEFWYAAGRVNETLGDDQEADTDFTRSVQLGGGMTPERAWRKLEAKR